MHCLEAYPSVLNVISVEVRPSGRWPRAAMNWSLLSAHFNNSSLIATECRSKMDWERSHGPQLRRWSLSGMVNSYMLDRHVSYLKRSGSHMCIRLSERPGHPYRIYTMVGGERGNAMNGNLQAQRAIFLHTHSQPSAGCIIFLYLILMQDTREPIPQPTWS